MCKVGQGQGKGKIKDKRGKAVMIHSSTHTSNKLEGYYATTLAHPCVITREENIAVLNWKKKSR